MRNFTKTLLIVGVIAAAMSGLGASKADARGFGRHFNYRVSCYTPRFCTTSYYVPRYRCYSPSYRCYRTTYINYGYNRCFTPGYGYGGYYGGYYGGLGFCAPHYGYSYYTPYTRCYTPSYYSGFGFGW